MYARASRPLVVSSAALLVLIAGHDLTHALDDGLDTSLGALAVVAVPQWIVLAVVMAVIVRGERTRAAVGALLLGLGATLGFVVIHLLPVGPASYWSLHPSPVSWVMVWAPGVLGLVVAALAWRELRAERPALSPRAA